MYNNRESFEGMDPNERLEDMINMLHCVPADLSLSIVHGCGQESVRQVTFDQTRRRQFLHKQRINCNFVI